MKNNDYGLTMIVESESAVVEELMMMIEREQFYTLVSFILPDRVLSFSWNEAEHRYRLDKTEYKEEGQITLAEKIADGLNSGNIKLRKVKIPDA